MSDLSSTNNGQHFRTATMESDTATLSYSSPGPSAFVPLPPPTQQIPDANTIPPTHANRTLVLCFDGTGDQFDTDNSNIVELFTMLKKDDADKQRVYYQAGIGTYTTPEIATPLMAKVSKTLDEMIAWNLDQHVIGGYEFLMEHYSAGDHICIFGFSRGAYTARALAGMIHKVGLLPRGNHQQVPFAYKMYSRADETGWKQSTAFKKAFSINVIIEFLGVWDTVNSCGLIPRTLPFTTSNSVVRFFRHAVSLDERRAKFKANLWNRPSRTEDKLGLPATSVTVSEVPAAKSAPTSPVGATKQSPASPVGSSFKQRNQKTQRNFERTYEVMNAETDIDEVWFAGCHCDIGGGSVSNGSENTLARIPLRWMIREVFKSKVGIMFNTDGLRGIGIDPDRLYPEVLSRPPALSAAGAKLMRVPTASETKRLDELNAARALAQAISVLPVIMTKTEEEEELLDAMSPVYDQLAMHFSWWILELFPVKQRVQNDDNTWQSPLALNLGTGRTIPHRRKHPEWKVRVHRSVKQRMEAQFDNGEKYLPKAQYGGKALKFGEFEVEWVD